MTATQSLLAFLIAAGLLTVTPGADTVMVLRTAAVEGPRRAMLAAIGIGAGCLVWGIGVALGLGALMAASPAVFMIVRWVGAAYLAWIGARLILRPRDRLDIDDTEAASIGGLIWLRRGLVTNLLNPKIGIFYIGFLPQFVPAAYPVAATMLSLVGLHVAMGLLWFALLIGATLPLRRILTLRAVVRTMDRVTGTVFVALATKLAVSR